MDKGTDVLAEAFDKVYNKRLSNLARFIFWDPSPEIADNKQTRAMNLSYNLSPNPAQNQQQLRLQLNQSGLVQVDILDVYGRLIQQAFNGQLEKGNQQLDINLSNLSANNYYYRITTNQGMPTIPISIL